MAEKNIQIKIWNDQTSAYDDLFPQTKAELVVGLDTSLANKVDKEAGKGLSTNDYTNADKAKVATIDNKLDSSEKGQANGVASLDGNGKVPLSQLPDAAKGQTYVVSTPAQREALTGLIEGDRAYETSTGDSYIWDGSSWLVAAKAEWENVNLDWNNINNVPTGLDQAISQRHTHTNKATLDKITASGSESSFDLSNMATLDDIADLGGGDMLKATYDKNDNGKVDVAETAESVPWSGVTGVPEASTSQKGIVQLSNSVSSTSNTLAATASAVKSVNDLASSKASIAVSAAQPAQTVDLWFQEI